MITNETRYRTEDLEALVDFCVVHAPSTHKQPPEAFHFFEFRPRMTAREKTYRVARFEVDSPVYGPEYVNSRVRYVKTQRDQPGIVWVAAPDIWMESLAQLAWTDEAEEILLPSTGVRMLADAITSSWHFQNVMQSLTLSVRVAPESKKKRARASEARVVKRNKYVAVAASAVDLMRRIDGELDQLTAIRHQMRELAGQIVIRDALADSDLLHRCARTKEEMERAKSLLLESIAEINGTKDQA